MSKGNKKPRIMRGFHWVAVRGGVEPMILYGFLQF